MSARRDEWGWITYPFWNAVIKVVPFQLFRWHLTRNVWLWFASRAYGEKERWNMKQHPEWMA